MSRVVFDGCQLDVVSKKTGLPIRKPWKISSSSQTLRDRLDSFKCPRDHKREVCQGSDTKATGFYTEKTATQILKGIFSRPKRNVVSGGLEAPESITLTATREQLIGCPKSQNVVKHMTNQIDKAIRKADSWLKELKENSKQLKNTLDAVASATIHPTNDLQLLLQGKAHREMAAVLRQHRQKLSGVQAVSLLGLVTKLLSRSDAEYHTPQAKKVLLDEALKLVLGGVWSEKAESKSNMAK